MPDFKSLVGRDLLAAGPFTGTSVRELASQGGKPCLSTTVSSIEGAVGTTGQGKRPWLHPRPGGESRADPLRFLPQPEEPAIQPLALKAPIRFD